jgi:hypothetical protein
VSSFDPAPLGRQLDALVMLAEQVHDELSDGEFEASLSMRNEYNDAFAQFQMTVAGGAPITPDLAPQLRRLEQVHGANMAIVSRLRDSARENVGSARQFKRIGGYAPNGANHVPVPRFIDDAA